MSEEATIETAEKLPKLASRICGELSKHRSDKALESIRKPRWESATPYGDWEYYVLPSIREMWEILSIEARLAVYAMAASEADR